MTAAMPAESTAPLGDLALEYARAGRLVFPLQPRGKQPLGELVPHGLKDASAADEQIRAWWTAEPYANIGIRTGAGAYDVLDIDGAEARAQLLELARQSGVSLVKVPRVATGGGGWHLLFAATGLGNRAGILPGIDWRGKGGYVVAPGSVHPNGRPYRWELRPNGSLPEVPAFLLELLHKRRRADASDTPTRVGRPPDTYVRAALDNELRMLRSASSGTRNDTLNRAAFAVGQLVGAGWISEQLGEAELRAAGLALGLEELEVERTVRSGLEGGKAEPRSAPAPAAATPPAIAPAPEPAPAAEHVRRLHFITARELGEMADAELDWIVEGQVAPGTITELDGAQKLAGKSTYARLMIAAVLEGRQFLGRATKRGPVVMLCEEGKKPLRAGLGRRGLLERDDLHLLPWSEAFGVSWSEIVRQAVERAREVGAELLVIDTLPGMARLRGDAENSAGEALEAMEPLRLAAAAGLAILITRHDRRAGGSVGESGRGSTAISGDVDIVLRLTRLGGEGRDNVRKLEGIGRFDEVPAELVLELTENGYEVIGTESDLKSREARELLLDALPDDVTDAIGLPALWKPPTDGEPGGPLHGVDISPRTFRNVADELLKAGIVRRVELTARKHLWYVCNAPAPAAHTSTEPAEAVDVGRSADPPHTHVVGGVAALAHVGADPNGQQPDPFLCPKCGGDEYVPLGGGRRRCNNRRCGYEWTA